MKVNCSYCGQEIERHLYQNQAKYCCFTCRKERMRTYYQRVDSKRKRKSKGATIIK